MYINFTYVRLTSYLNTKVMSSEAIQATMDGHIFLGLHQVKVTTDGHITSFSTKYKTNRHIASPATAGDACDG